MPTAALETPSRATLAIPRSWIIAIALAGLIVRLAVLAQTSALDVKIEDERQYVRLAASLLHGDGFAWAPGEPTSLRPPLYPAVLAGIWHFTGEGRLQPIRFMQAGLSLLTALCVYAIGRRVWNARVGAIGAAIAWLDPTAIYLNSTILTETLFTALLVAFVLATVMVVQTRTWASALCCGFALGLGALTRSVLWPVPLLLCPLLLVLVDGTWRRRLTLAAIVFVGYAVVVTPWAVRNTRLQRVTTIVDTMGGLNLRMGNYEHTPEDRMWDAVSMKGERSWVYALAQEGHPSGAAITEGEKDKWAQAKAIAYMKAHPGTTLRRSIIKFTDFWGLERSFIAGVQQGLYRVAMPVAAVAAILMLVSSAALMLLFAIGLWVARPAWRLHVVLLLPIVVLAGVHAIVFGHARYHAPLVPLMALYATALVRQGGPRQWLSQRPAIYAGALCCLILVAGWTRHMIVVDGDHLRALWQRLF